MQIRHLALAVLIIAPLAWLPAAADALAEARQFMQDNASKPNITTTDSGLQYQILRPGKGTPPGATDTVVVHYAGRLTNGEQFDSSYDRGQPARFGLNQVIRGWTEGLQYLTPGAKARLFIPPELGYGDRAVATIPPNSVLIFDIELLEVQ